MPVEFALETRGLSKSFNGKLAVDAVDMQVVRGEIVGFLGLNGAGKTTIMNMILGLMRPDAGEITILGQKDGSRKRELRSRIGYLQEKPRIYSEMTARGYLQFFADLYAIDNSRSAVAEMLELVDLSRSADRPLQGYSRGMQQRVCLARCLLHQPDFMILDEPMLGLDPKGISEMRNIFRNLRDAGTTLLFSSHQLAEMEKVCDSVILLQEGRIVASGRQDELLSSKAGGNKVVAELYEPAEQHVEAVKTLENVQRVDVVDANRLLIEMKQQAGESIRDSRASLVIAMNSLGLTVLSVSGSADSLEHIFRQFTESGRDTGRTLEH
ncbi:MAG: ABC transporter ATP-binding protein [Rhizobiaceae bacterium]